MPNFFPSIQPHFPDFGTIIRLDYSNPDFIYSGFCLFILVGLLGFVLWVVDNLFAPIDVTPYGICGFFGKRGSGKSLGMTTYARRWRHFNPNKPVFTNMEKLILPGKVGNADSDGHGGHKPPCRCIHKHVPLADSDELDTHNQCTYLLNKCKAIHTDCNFAQISACRDGMVCIDEAGVFISNLNFADRKNRQFAKWLVATRHFKVKVMMTAHTPGSINNRLRDVTDQFVEMTAFTTLHLFRGWVYDSGKAYGIPDKKSHTIWIPMLPTTTKSYNTDSLRVQADRSETNIIGEDFELPWEGDGEAPTKLEQQKETTSSGSSGEFGTTAIVGNLPRSRTNGSIPNGSYASNALVDMELLDATILSTLVAKTAETWNGRKEKPKIRQIASSRKR